MSKSLKSAFCRAVFSGAATVGLAWAGQVEAQTQTTTGGSSLGGSSIGGGASRGGSGGQGSGQSAESQSSVISGTQGAFGIATGQSRSPYRLGGTTGASSSSNGNQLTQFYANPLSHGVTGSTGTRTFGQPLYANTTSGSAGGLGVGTGFGVSTGTGMSTGAAGGGSRGGTTGTTGSFGRTGATGTTGTGVGSGTLGGTGALGGNVGGGRTGGTGLGTAGGTGLGGGNLGALGGPGTTGMGQGTGRGTTSMMGGMTGNTLGGMNTGLTGGRNAAGGVTSANVRRSVPYVAELAPSIRPATTPLAAGNLRTQAQGVITRSSAFAANRDIQVNTEGAVVVLHGAVGDDRERQLAEALIRLTPGVRDVRNELQVRETTPAPTPIPD